MALYVSISINQGEPIHTFGAQNINGRKKGANSYRVCKYVPDENGNMKRVYLSGTLVHQYEDGAIKLAKEVLDFVMWMEKVNGK